MRTHDAIEPDDYRRVDALTRDADRLPTVVRDWYEAARPPAAGGREVSEAIAGLEPLFLQAMRPFLSRCADAVMARTVFGGWRHGTCPLCGGEPDFSIITPSAERLLMCSRCLSRWRFHQLACPFCLNADRSRITSFATRDGLYRLNACDVCQRYVKAFDGRNAPRPVMPVVDSYRYAAPRRRSGAARLSLVTSLQPSSLVLVLGRSGCRPESLGSRCSVLGLDCSSVHKKRQPERVAFAGDDGNLTQISAGL